MQGHVTVTTTIHGELVLGPKEMQFATFNDMKAIFDRAGTRSKIIVSPITRFVTSRAATARTTCRTSRRSTSSTSRWRQCRRNRNDFSFGLGLRHIRVLSPSSCLQQRGDSMWAPDGVHRKEEGYKTTAEQVVMVKVVNKRERENDETPQLPNEAMRRLSAANTAREAVTEAGGHPPY